MAYKVQKPCKICGKLYTPCSDCEHDNTAFHWRTVACSVECGQEYLQKVISARDIDNKSNTEATNRVKERKPNKSTSVNEKESEQIE
ncbi:hypothetical protein DS742_13950 [Lacrimispora amygdalina]|uniref:Uncharacterized protein n=1 Tax=Lacrimispora amygdalina TaxID=253257 RepID=A0A3E2NB22_9FIRM|nr:hypothetical protein DS742_13950 [Clostridium indicum]